MPDFSDTVIKHNDNINEIKLQKRNFISSQSPNDIKATSSAGSERVKIYKLGEKGSGIRLQGAIQDYDQLKLECLSNGKLFEDPEFPAENSSLFASIIPRRLSSGIIEWKRPKEIVDNPQFYVEGSSRFDVVQGKFGNCWMHAALATLAMRPELLENIIPPNQNFEQDYAGIFRFRFWQFGKWIEVVIDDRLPVYNGKLISAHSPSNNEFWNALLEKAYAKVHGYWEALETGIATEALEDFTGGISQYYYTKAAPSELFDILLEAQKKNSLLCCGIYQVKEGSKKAKKLSEKGLIEGHVYSITKVKYVRKMTENNVEKIPLLRVRNPHGQKEWNGAWSYDSPEWDSISTAEKEEMGFMKKEDGEFWISLQAFKLYFDYLQICYLEPSLLIPENLSTGKNNWEVNLFNGEWVRGVSAGGSVDELEFFQYNPQYRITLEKTSIVIVALKQKNLRTQRPKEEKIFLPIEIHIYKLPEDSQRKLAKPLNLSIFEDIEELRISNFLDNEPSSKLQSFLQLFQIPIAHSHEYDIGCRIELQPGSYCIIPSTFDSDIKGEFLLRVFSENPISMEEYDVEVARCEVDDNILEKSDLDKREKEITRIMKQRKYFRQAAHEDWELDWNECKLLVQRLLEKELTKEGFGEDSCRSIVALLDEDCSGKLGYHEFQKFWKKCKIWTVAFDIYDEDGSKELQEFQLREVLKNAGYNLNNRILNLIMRRYGEENGHVKFTNYFICVARLDKMIDNYDELVASDEINPASLTLEKWIRMHVNSS